MKGICLCLVYHVCNAVQTYCWFPSVFFRWFAHGLVKPIGNSIKWTQSAVKRKEFENGAKSMVTESAIMVIEIARCLFSKQAKTAGPQWKTLPCFCMHICIYFSRRMDICLILDVFSIFKRAVGVTKNLADGTLFPKEIYMKHNNKQNLTINTWLGSQR